MVVKLRPHQLRSIIFLTIHGVDFTLPHDCYGVINSWWDHGHFSVDYYVINTKDGLLVKMFHFDSINFLSPKFIERSLLFAKGMVNGKPVPTKDRLQDWIKEVPDLTATRWSEYHNSLRWFDVDRLFYADPFLSFEEEISGCLEVVNQIP